MADPITSNPETTLVPIVPPTVEQAWYHNLHGYAGIVLGLGALVLVVGKCLADPSIHNSQDMLTCLLQGALAVGVANAGLAHLKSQPAGN